MTTALSTIDLATLAEVGMPTSNESPGAVFLRQVAAGVLADLREVGDGLHVDCLRLAVEDAFPSDPCDPAADFAVFVDLGLWAAEERTTEAALQRAGMRLAAALVAAHA